MKVAHESFADIVTRLANFGFGKEFASREAAYDQFRHAPVGISDACLLAIVKQMETFLDALTQSRMRQKLESEYTRMMSEAKEWITPLEEKHGPCPDIVKHWLHGQIECRAVSRFCYGELCRYAYIHESDKPKTGTAERKAYDRWKRRKNPAATKQK